MRLLYRSSLVSLTTIWPTRADTPLPCSLHPFWVRIAIKILGPYRINVQNTAEATLSHCRLLFCKKSGCYNGDVADDPQWPGQTVFSIHFAYLDTLMCTPGVFLTPQKDPNAVTPICVDMPGSDWCGICSAPPESPCYRKTHRRANG